MINRKIIYNILCLVLSLTMCLGFCMPSFADDEETTASESSETTEAASSSQSVVVSYSVAKSDGTAGSIEKGDTVTVTVKLKNFKLNTENCTAVDITRTPDSFRDGSCSTQIISNRGNLLRYNVTFSNLKYTGKGQTLSFIVLYKGTDCDPETMSVTIDECTEYTAEETTAKTNDAPLIVISRGSLDAVKPGESFSVDVNIRNTSDIPVYNASAVLDAGDGLILEEAKASRAIGTIAASSSVKFTVRLKADKKAETSPLALNVSLKYTYSTGSASADGSADEKLLIPLNTSGSSGSSAATPNIIVTDYSYGGSSVAAGDKFTLSVTFTNTSKSVDAENIVMAVQTGDALSITSASNTYFLSALKAGGSKTVSIEMQVPANAGSGDSSGTISGAKADITFNYEYVADGTRTAANTSESLSVPVYMPDRFSVTEPETVYAAAGEEVNLSVPYINRGKGTVSNVEAKITFENEDAAYCEESKQQLGNFEAGKSGTIDFFFTPNEAGELKFTVTVNYEDEMTELKTVELPMTIQVEEGSYGEEGYEEEYYEEEEESSGNAKWIVIGSCAAAAVIAAVIVIIVIKKRRKKKNSTALPDNFDWNDSPLTETPSAENPEEKAEDKAENTENTEGNAQR